MQTDRKCAIIGVMAQHSEILHELSENHHNNGQEAHDTGRPLVAQNDADAVREEDQFAERQCGLEEDCGPEPEDCRKDVLANPLRHFETMHE